MTGAHLKGLVYMCCMWSLPLLDCWGCGLGLHGYVEGVRYRWQPFSGWSNWFGRILGVVGREHGCTRPDHSA